MIAVLMGSFPTSKIPEPEIFVRVLMDDVMALDPSFVEMEATCRHLRKTKKFMPSVSEVIETLEEQKKLWDRRSDVVWFMEEWYDDLPAIAKAKAAEEARMAKAKAEEEQLAKKAEEAAKAADRTQGGQVTADRRWRPCPQFESWRWHRYGARAARRWRNALPRALRRKHRAQCSWRAIP